MGIEDVVKDIPPIDLDIHPELRIKQLEWAELIGVKELLVKGVISCNLERKDKLRLLAVWFTDARHGRTVDFPQTYLELQFYRLYSSKQFLNLYSLVCMIHMSFAAFESPTCVWEVIQSEKSIRIPHDNGLTYQAIAGYELLCCFVYGLDIFFRVYVNHRDKHQLFSRSWFWISVVSISIIAINAFVGLGTNRPFPLTKALIPLIYIARRRSLRNMVQGAFIAIQKSKAIFLLLISFLTYLSYIGYLIFRHIDTDTGGKFNTVFESFLTTLHAYTARGFSVFVLTPYFEVKPATALFFVFVTVTVDIIIQAFLIGNANKEFKAFAGAVFKRQLRNRKIALTAIHRALSEMTAESTGTTPNGMIGMQEWLDFVKYLPNVKRNPKVSTYLFNTECHPITKQITCESMCRLCALLDSNFSVNIELNSDAVLPEHVSMDIINDDFDMAKIKSKFEMSSDQTPSSSVDYTDSSQNVVNPVYKATYADLRGDTNSIELRLSRNFSADKADLDNSDINNITSRGSKQLSSKDKMPSFGRNSFTSLKLIPENEAVHDIDGTDSVSSKLSRAYHHREMSIFKSQNVQLLISGMPKDRIRYLHTVLYHVKTYLSFIPLYHWKISEHHLQQCVPLYGVLFGGSAGGASRNKDGAKAASKADVDAKSANSSSSSSAPPTPWTPVVKDEYNPNLSISAKDIIVMEVYPYSILLILSRIILAFALPYYSNPNSNVTWDVVIFLLQVFFWIESLILRSAKHVKYVRRGFGVLATVNVLSFILLCAIGRVTNVHYSTSRIVLLFCVIQTVHFIRLFKYLQDATVYGSLLLLVFRVIFTVFCIMYMFAIVAQFRFCNCLQVDKSENNDDIAPQWVPLEASLNFNTFLNSLLTLFEVSVLGNWSIVMMAASHVNKPAALIFFYFYRITMSVVILPIMTAFIIQAFNSRVEQSKNASKLRFEATAEWKSRNSKVYSGRVTLAARDSVNGDGSADVGGRDSDRDKSRSLSGKISLAIGIREENLASTSMMSYWSESGRERYTKTTDEAMLLKSEISQVSLRLSQEQELTKRLLEEIKKLRKDLRHATSSFEDLDYEFVDFPLFSIAESNEVDELRSLTNDI